MKLSLPQLIHDDQPFDAPIIPERMTWTASSLKLFRACPRKFFWKYMFRLRPKHYDKNLAFGSAFHKTLAEWYRSRRSDMTRIVEKYAVPLEQYAEEAASYYDEEDYTKLMALVEGFRGMMFAYADHYWHDRNKWRIEPASIEQQFQIDMGDFDLRGKIDLIARTANSSTLTLVEHKSASGFAMNESYVTRLPLDTQVRCYILGARKGLGYKITEVLYDAIRKSQLRRKKTEEPQEFWDRIKEDYLKRPEFYFLREPLKFGKTELDSLELAIRQTHSHYLIIAKPLAKVTTQKELQRAIDDHLPPVDDPNAWYPDDSECNAYFRMCEYHDLCISGLDKSHGKFYDQLPHMHDELQEAE